MTLHRHKNWYRCSACTLLLGACLVVATASSADDASTMDSYFSAYIDARAHTIDGVRERLFMLERGVAADASFADANQQTRVRVDAAYARYGFTPSSHLDFGTRFDAVLQQWLAENPDVARVLDEQDQAMTALSSRIREFSREQ